MMFTADCPWCDGPMAVVADEDGFECPSCAVRVEFAPDPAPTTLDVAA